MEKKEKIVFTVIAAGVLVSGGLMATSIYDSIDHTQYAKIASPHPKSDFARAVKSKAPLLAIYYSHDCKDCKLVQDTVSDNVKKQEDNHSAIKYLVMDKRKTGKNFMIDNKVIETPTFQVRRGDKIIYQYAGTDKAKITDIIAGINPETKQPFDFN